MGGMAFPCQGCEWPSGGVRDPQVGQAGAPPGTVVGALDRPPGKSKRNPGDLVEGGVPKDKGQRPKLAGLAHGGSEGLGALRDSLEGAPLSAKVSHHPPISACHAESENFVFWQDMKWKNKFWGKSLEIVPVGTINVSLPRFGDHFEWNKVTSCIHNILSGQRWIEHYGEVLIRNTQDSSCHCKITFCKAKYWSSNVHEVQGAVLSRSGRVLHRLFGKWHEGLYRGLPPGGQCIWKPNSMPPDHERNFGFTQFALELNELTAELKRALPSTDTRLRPDQRYLEEGNIQAAEAQKRRIEQLQRDRRRVMEENNIAHQARFFRRQMDGSGKEWWVTNNTYWRLRAEPGYGNLDGAVLW